MTMLLNAQAAMPALFGRIARILRQKGGTEDSAPVALRIPASEIAQDCNILPEDVTGRPAWDQDMPFFLQSGFGRD